MFCLGAADQPTLSALLPVQLHHTWSGNHVIFVQSEIGPEGKQFTVLSRVVSVFPLSSAMISPNRFCFEFLKDDTDVGSAGIGLVRNTQVLARERLEEGDLRGPK